MKKKLLLCAVVAIVAMVGIVANEANATIMSFTIKGTYGETLPGSPGNPPLFSQGDTFTISGTYDTAQQPSVETKGSGTVTLTDAGFMGSYINYSSIVSLTSNIPLAAINSIYPSAESGTAMGFNDSDTKTGSYFTDSNMFGALGLGLDIYESYTHLTLQNTAGTLSGSLSFNYRETSEKEGDFTHYDWVNDTISLDVTSFETYEAVPVPPSMLLLGTGLAGLVCTKVRRKRKW